MNLQNTRIAVLGAGITGASAALMAARQGAQVVLFDRLPEAVSAASRWNEGKIHLGYLYAGDRTLDTVRQILPGGLKFRRTLEALIEQPLKGVTDHADTYAVHRNSVTSLQDTVSYFRRVTETVREHPDAQAYFLDLREADIETLSTSELSAQFASDDIIGAVRVPERSVSTNWVADQLVRALAAEPRIEQRMGTEILGVEAAHQDWSAPLSVNTNKGRHSSFDYVINALWEGRLCVDQTANMPLPAAWTHRYRLSVFARTPKASRLRSAVICTGPFGDVKNYNNGEYYLSWYEAGLGVTSRDMAPPAAPVLSRSDQEQKIRQMMEGLGQFMPEVKALVTGAEKVTLGGGWVYAVGEGSLADPRSKLHRRDRIGIIRRGRYISVDTGKYSCGPSLAETVVRDICA